MKSFFVAVILAILSFSAHAQFNSARLQATGLTCAMCSNAVHKALQKVSFVESVKSDIKNSSFAIRFKEGTEADIDALRTAVEDAGFSIGSLKLNGRFDKVMLENDRHVKIGNQQFHFVDITSQELSGEKEITIIDKDFVTDKVFRKYRAATKKACINTGKTESCCEKEGLDANTRIYHATI
jgi:copper chaperone CopZ